jgi:hypothetical protein
MGNARKKALREKAKKRERRKLEDELDRLGHHAAEKRKRKKS